MVYLFFFKPPNKVACDRATHEARSAGLNYPAQLREVTSNAMLTADTASGHALASASASATPMSAATSTSTSTTNTSTSTTNTRATSTSTIDVGDDFASSNMAMRSWSDGATSLASSGPSSPVTPTPTLNPPLTPTSPLCSPSFELGLLWTTLPKDTNVWDRGAGEGSISALNVGDGGGDTVQSAGNVSLLRNVVLGGGRGGAVQSARQLRRQCWVWRRARARVGFGGAAYDNAKAAVASWRHMNLPWVTTHPPPPSLPPSPPPTSSTQCATTPATPTATAHMTPGETVCVVARSLLLAWTLNPLRVLYVRDSGVRTSERGAAHREGRSTVSGKEAPERSMHWPLPPNCQARWWAGVGTVQGHFLAGEERFGLELHMNGDVWFEICSVSRPAHPLAMLAYPVVAWQQSAFARDAIPHLRRLIHSHSALSGHRTRARPRSRDHPDHGAPTKFLNGDQITSPSVSA